MSAMSSGTGAVGEREGLQQPQGQQVVGGEHGLGPVLRGQSEQVLPDPASLQHRQGRGAEGFHRRAGHGVDRPLRPGPAAADLVQLRAAGVAPGSLENLRDLVARSFEPVRYGPRLLNPARRS